MKLRQDWKLLLRRAYSIRLAILAGTFSGIEIILPMFSDSIPRGLFAILSLAAAIGVPVARVMQQKGIGDE